MVQAALQGVWDSGLLSYEQAEALGFRGGQALQKHTEQLWGTLGVDIVQLTVCTVLAFTFSLVFLSTFSVNLQIQIQEMEIPSQQCIFLPGSALGTHLK